MNKSGGLLQKATGNVVNTSTSHVPKHFKTIVQTLNIGLYANTKEGKVWGYKPEKHVNRDYLDPSLRSVDGLPAPHLKRFPNPRTLALRYIERKTSQGQSKRRSYTTSVSTPSRSQIGQIHVGDFVSSRKLGDAHRGIVLSQTKGKKLLVAESDGSISIVMPRDVVFKHPGLVPEDVATASIPILAHQVDELLAISIDGILDFTTLDTDVSRKNRRIITRALRKFNQDVTSTYSSNVRIALHKFYYERKNSDHDLPKDVPIDDAVEWLKEQCPQMADKPDYLLRYRVVEHMLDDPVRYIADGENVGRGEMTLRPWNRMDDIEVVRKWTRLGSHQLQAFVDRVRLTLAQHNKYRVYPWKAFDIRAHFTRMFRTLRLGVLESRLMQAPPYATLLQNIVARLGTDVKPGKKMDVAAVEVFQATRLWPRWDNLVLAEPSLQYQLNKTPLDHPALLHVGPNARETAHVYKEDPLLSIRRDFGQLTVYVIDDTGAKELDDGMSIEPTQTSDGKDAWWIHVHVADPTSIMAPRHKVSRKAARQMTTLYLPEQTVPMLPPNDLFQPEQFSLGSQQPGEAQPVLTFSFKMLSDGTVVDQKVEPGFVRNVIRTTYDAVNDVFQDASRQPAFRQGRMNLLWNATSPNDPEFTKPPRHVDELNEQAMQDLRQLKSLTQALYQSRVRNGAVFWTFPAAEINVSEVPPVDKAYWDGKVTRLRKRSKVENPEVPPLQLSIPGLNQFHYFEEPHLHLNLPGLGATMDDPRLTHVSAASTLVAECMVQANRVAARFAREHELVVPYATQAAPLGDASDIEAFLAKRDAHGAVTPLDYIEASQAIDIAQSSHSLQAGPHWGLGINDSYGYLRATSPLRRYSDLFAHWQIKSVMLPDLRRKLDDAANEQVKDYARMVGLRSGKDRLGDRSRMHWILYTLSQYWHQHLEGTAHESVTHLFQSLTGVCKRKRYSGYEMLQAYELHIPELGVPAVMQMPIGFALQPGESLRVQIHDFDLRNIPRVTVKPMDV